MIAPLGNPLDDPAASERNEPLEIARQIVAAALLPPPPEKPAAPRVPAWQAWLVAAWMAVVTLAYGLAMTGWWRP